MIMKPKSKKTRSINKSKKNVAVLDVANAAKQGVALGLRGLGGMLGSMVGAPAMGAQGGAWLSKITGFGDYEIGQNTLMTTGVPSFQKGNRKITVSHREFVTDIFSSTSFAVTSYAINPGNPNVFPWLSNVAESFQQYKFRGLIFEFVSSSADALNSINTALGTVIAATNYNANQPAYASKQEMEASEFSCRTKPSTDVIHPIECAATDTPISHLYVRTGPIPSGQDGRLYDLGNFQLATVGMQQSAVNIGELWVSYEVELYKPRLVAIGGYAFSDDWGYRSGSAYTNADPFNTAGLTVPVVGGLGTTVNNTVLTFPTSINNGCYKVQCSWVGSSTAQTIVTPTLSGCSLNTNYKYGGVVGTGTVTATLAVMEVYININTAGSSATLTFSGLTLPSSGTAFELVILPAPTIPNQSPY